MKNERTVETNKMTELENEIMAAYNLNSKYIREHIKGKNKQLLRVPEFDIIDWNGARSGGIFWFEWKGGDYVCKYHETETTQRMKILKHTGNTGNFYYRMEDKCLNELYYDDLKNKRHD